MKTVLVAIDFPVATGLALEASILLAQAFGARLVALHVVPPPPNSSEPAALRHPDSAATRSEQAALQLANLQRRLQQRGITIQTRHVVGHPGPRIVESAALLAATYVVVGAHDRGGGGSSDLGGTALQVLREAPCPVVIVPPTVRL